MKADAPGPSAEDEARVVSLLRGDVQAAIGPGHGGAIIEAAARRRLYDAGGFENLARQVKPSG